MTPNPTDLDPWEAMRLQILQSQVEHEIVARALVVVCAISLVCVLALGILAWVMWRRSVTYGDRLLEETRFFFAEQERREKRHSQELIAQQKQSGLELDSITRMQWQEFAAAVWTKRAG